ncbi:MAG: OB-fold nucleic acid binding domain-containing protein, partial [Anaerotignaceae bacterium]
LEVLKRKVSCTSLNLMATQEEKRIIDGTRVKYGGIITEKTIKYTRNGKVMCFLKVEDVHGGVEVIVFPNTYEKFQNLLFEDAIILLEGRVQVEEEADGKIICETIFTLKEEKNETLFVKVESEKSLEQLLRLLKKYKGNTPVKVRNAQTGMMLNTPPENWVDGSDGLIAELKLFLGNNNVVLKAK